MGKSGIKIALKIVAWIVSVLLALDLLLVGLLFVPSIQTFVVHKVTDALNQKFNMGISIKSVHITPTLKLVANEVAIKDHHHENMIYSRVVKGRLRKIKTKPITLGLGDVVFDDFDMVLRTYVGEDTINISKWADAFESDQPMKIFKMTSNTVDVNHGRFVLINDNDRVVFDTTGHPGIDYAFLELADINIKAKDFLLVNDDIAMKINKLSFDQYGGFHLNNLSADFRISDTTLTLNNMRLKTDQSDLDMDLCFLYDYWTTYAEFLDSVYITSIIRPSTLSMVDVAGWASNIRGMDEVFQIEKGSFEGVVNDFNIQNIAAGWRGRNLVQGDIAIRNVTDFLHAGFDVDLDSSYVFLPDLSSFTLPRGNTIPKIPFLKRVEYAVLDGTFQGTIDDFDTHLWANTALGSVTTNISTTSASGKLAIKGDVSTADLRIAKLLNMSSGLLSSCALTASFDGEAASTGYSAENLKTLNAHLSGHVNRLTLLGYPLRDILLEGDYKKGFYNATVKANDPNLQCEAVAQLDNTQSTPFLQGNINQLRLGGGDIGRMIPPVDSAKAKGLEKLIVMLQRDPSMSLNIEQFQIATHGTNLDNVNGFIACDKFKIKYKEDSIVNDRLRLTAINYHQFHKYILSSNIANAMVESNYPILTVADSLQNMAHNLFPSLVPTSNRINAHKAQRNGESNPAAYIKLNLSTYHTRTLTKLLTPDMFIAPNSTIILDVRSDHESDRVEVDLPLFVLRNKFRLHNFHMDGSTSDAKTLALNLSGDSILVHVGQGKLLFDQVDLKASSSNDIVHYNLSWHNAFNSEGNISSLQGLANLTRPEDIVIQLQPSKIFLKDYECHFNEKNAIHIMPHSYLFDNLTFSTQNSSVTLNGTYDTKDSSKLSMAAKNLDISLVNPLLSGISFGGSLSADLNLANRKGTRLIYGKAITDELVVNDARLGDLFLIAGINNDNNIRFSGGLFNSDKSHFDYEYLLNYSIRDFQAEDRKIADVRGSFSNKIFDVKMDFDTLQAGFLEPFLSAFSDELSGTASGSLRFHAAPDSSYLDGKVHVLNAEMGIAALGTHYFIEDQDIIFNKEGISFQNMEFMDKDRNKGMLSGEIRHNLFKDMQIDLQVNTDRLMVLNAQRSTNAFFYGIGYVQGAVHIFNSNNELSFIGPNLTTLKGSKIVLQVSSTNSASETNLIHFQTRKEESSDMDEGEESSSMDLNFDFTFDVTRDADIVLILESINGTMNARADGRFRLTYNHDDLNLYGNLFLHSGDFKLSLYNVVNPKFTMVPGGSISFDGPLENMTTDLSAYKTSKASLANIVPAEDLSGNTEVKAIINLRGQLMRKIEPTFSFELPNASNDVRNSFYTSIDTQNTENMTKQFAYFIVTNSFMPENMFGGNITISGLTGFGLLSTMVNNVLSNVIDSQKASFGITYNQATETSSAEYGLKANANFLNDRMTMSTSIGYYDDRTAAAAYNNIYGDISVEYNINKSGTWRVKAYTYIGNRDNNYYLYETSYNYTAGVALAYKQDFDRIATRKKNKERKTNKNNKRENVNGQQ